MTKIPKPATHRDRTEVKGYDPFGVLYTFFLRGGSPPQPTLTNERITFYE
jgi:hypothetical protein